MKTLEQSAPVRAAGAGLRELFANRQAKIGLIGLGYAGLPLAVSFAEAGFHVTGIDLAQDRVSALNDGRSYIGDVTEQRLQPIVNEAKLVASTDYAALADADAITICVPTPITPDKAPDPSAIAGAARSLAPYLRSGQLIVLESTSFPGTTQEILQPVFEARGFTVGKDIFLAFAPERVNPGDQKYGTRNTPKLIGGVTPECSAVAAALYQTIVDEVISVSSPQVAEMAKLLENTFRQINVAFANEMAIVCEHLGIDVWEVIDAAATKPFGFMPFYPGPGLGGPCIPVVPHYLAWKAKSLGYETRLIALADEINDAMPHHVVDLVRDALAEEGKSIKGARVVMLGITYKPDVSDMRESPPTVALAGLLASGAIAGYHDPLNPQVSIHGEVLESVPLNEETLRAADCVVIATNHSLFDLSWIVANSSLIVDTRNATFGIEAVGDARSTRIVKLGAPRCLRSSAE